MMKTAEEVLDSWRIQGQYTLDLDRCLSAMKEFAEMHTKSCEEKIKREIMIEYLKDGIKVNGEFILLSEVIEKCNKVKVKNSVLFTISKWEYSRGFDGVEEQLILTSENAEKLKILMIGREVNFGEIAGKHSEVYGVLREEDFKINKDKKTILKFMMENPSGTKCNYSFIENIEEYLSDKLYGEDLNNPEFTEDIEFLKLVGFNMNSLVDED